MQMEIDRAPIQPAGFSRPFWDATKDRRLLLQYCPITEQYQFYPRPVSIFSGHRALEWRESSGAGALYSLTISHLGPRAFSGAVPYAVGLVQLDEGVRIIGGLTRLAPADWRIGMRVKPDWLPINDGYHLLQFQPAE
jgi:uncharacterized OB-fold protein